MIKVLVEQKLIIGLGNPGSEYEHTRHNIGFLIVRKLAEEYQVKFSQRSFLQGWVATAAIQDNKCCFFLPMTYMNNSGSAVKRFLDQKEILLENILVVCDDIHLNFRQLRLRAKGSPGGHNGLKSIIEHLGNDNFARLRLGIGSPVGNKDMVDFVLEEFTPKEKKELSVFIERGVECCAAWLTLGVHKAMNQFNKREKDG